MKKLHSFMAFVTAVSTASVLLFYAGCSNLTKSESASGSITPNGITLSSDSIILTKGETATVVATVTPVGASQNVVWELSGSNATDYAALTDNGDGSATVTALKIGAVHLRADAANVEKGSAQANCSVTITQIVKISFLDSETGSSLRSDISYKEGEVIASEPQPTEPKTGYTFAGWYQTVSEGKVSGDRVTFPHTVTADTCVFYGAWVANDATYTVTYDSQGGSAVSASANIVSGYTVSKPLDPVYSGYVFGGWYTDSGCTEGNVVSFPYTVTKNITLYAKWTKEASVVYVESVSLSETTLALKVGETSSLTATAAPATATNKSIEWSSSDESVATVSGGTVTALKMGTATVTAAAADKGTVKATCSLTVAAASYPVTGVTVTPESSSIQVGGTTKLTAEVSPSNASNSAVTWSSDNTAIATVSVNGTVTAVAVGTANIKATTTDGGYTAKCAVTVTASEVAVTGVSLSSSALSLEAGSSSTLTATVKPDNATNTVVTWTSSDTSIATVSNGIVTAVKEGSATIIVTTKDGSFQATCGVTVSAKQTVSDKIILHVYNYCNAYVWNTTSSTLNKTHTTLTQEGTTNWYKGTFGVTSMSLIFTTVAGGWTNQTGDLSLTAAGEYWYKNGTFTQYNPDDSEAPVLVSFTSDKSGAVSGSIVFTVSATDNMALSKAVLTVDSATLTTITMSGTAANGTYTWDTSNIANGTHTVKVVVYDSSENESTSTANTLTFTTTNANKAPVAVITGSKQVAPGKTKTFSGESSYDANGSIASYAWTVTGATISGSKTGSTVSVVMPSVAGTATLGLTVTDNDGASSAASSFVITISDKTEDFRDETIYFVITTRFYDGYAGNNRYCWDGPAANKTNNDPAWRGDFQGLIDKLDYIKALGFSAIWITPPVENASGYDYHGYHALNFSKIDDRYAQGSISATQAYQNFIDAAHAKGMKVIQDIVLNHTGNWGETNLYPMFTKGTDDGTTSPAMVEGGDKAAVLETAAATYGGSYASLAATNQYNARISAMKEDTNDTDLIYHHCKSLSWNGYECQVGQIAGDCVDLNTENPTVIDYLEKSYDQYINMGVDAFRVDTVKHVNRLMLNTYYMPHFMETGGDSFYIFGEVCARYRGRWNEGVPSLSPSFYTWKESSSYTTGTEAQNTASAKQNFTDYAGSYTPPVISGGANYLLVNNTYRTPDWSKRSYMDVIDFPMHWAFNSVTDAFSTATSYDSDYCDPTWNVTYVDSHDYAPDGAPENQRFAGYWPDKLDLMFTFRGIPCIFYGSEIEFQKGKVIDNGTNTALADTGRAYYGANLEGTVTASDFGEYTASGAVATTLSNALAQHIIRLNKIRRAVPALQKGQYSTEGCSGTVAFKRRYTDSSVDSFALVAINGQATFTGIPSGTYVEAVTGKSVTSSGSLTTDSISTGNMRVYVLKTSTSEVTGKIGTDGTYLY